MTAKLIHADLAQLRFCNRGSRQFFQRHGLNWSSFLQEGVDLDLIERIDDAMAQKAVRQAKQRLGID